MILVYYLLFLFLVSKKLLAGRKKILHTVFPELKSKIAFNQRKKEMSCYLKSVEPKNVKFEKFIFTMRVLIYLLILLLIINFMPLLASGDFAYSSRVVMLFCKTFIYIGIALLLIASMTYTSIQINQKNDLLLDVYLKEHPTNELKLLPYSKDFATKYYTLQRKISRFSFFTGILQILSSLLILFLH